MSCAKRSSNVRYPFEPLLLPVLLKLGVGGLARTMTAVRLSQDQCLGAHPARVRRMRKAHRGRPQRPLEVRGSIFRAAPPILRRHAREELACERIATDLWRRRRFKTTVASDRRDMLEVLRARMEPFPTLIMKLIASALLNSVRSRRGSIPANFRSNLKQACFPKSKAPYTKSSYQPLRADKILSRDRPNGPR